MPTPIAALASIDHHPVVAVAWSEQRPEDEIVAARAEAQRLESAWVALAALAPGALPDAAIIERLAVVERILRAVYSRSPTRLIAGWYIQEMHALIVEARRLLGENQLAVQLPWKPL